MPAAPEVLTIRVPLKLRRRGGRKLVLAPPGAPVAAVRPVIDNTLVKALARAHHWKRMFETGEYATLAALAEAERVNPSYLSRILRLSLLAPDIVQAILDGTQPKGLRLADLMAEHSIEWERQRRECGFAR